MYGKGNPVPRFGESPQRPMPLLPLPHGGFAPPPFQLRPLIQTQRPHPIQQPGAPDAVRPGPFAPAQASSIPSPLPQKNQAGSLSNPVQYQHLNAHHSRPMMNAYPGSQQTQAYPPHIRAQNVRFTSPPPLAPIPLSVSRSRAPPPAPSQPQQMFPAPKLSTPPQFAPPPSFTRTGASVFRPVRVDQISQSTPGNFHMLSLPYQVPTLPPSLPPPLPPPPPPPPLTESVPSPLATPSSATQSAASYGALQSDIDTNSGKAPISDAIDTTGFPLPPSESRGNGGSFDKGSLVTDGSASIDVTPIDLPLPPLESSDEKITGNMNSTSFLVGTASPADSDVDMEDDITHFDKDQMCSSSEEGQKRDCIPAGHKFEMMKQGDLQDSKDDHEEVKSSPLVDSRAAITNYKKSPESNGTDRPFRLIPNYALDESLEDDGVPSKDVNSMAASAVKEVEMATSHKIAISEILKSEISLENNHRLSVSNLQIEDVTPENESEPVVEEEILRIKDDELALQGDEIAGENGKTDASNHESFDTSQHTDAFGSSVGIDIPSVYVEKPRSRKNISVKVDEFGRMIREDISESDSDDSDKIRRNRKRGRSRSCSRSPQFRRRRTPVRRKDRRCRSRSWSPRKRRSRSRSPVKRIGICDMDKQRRGRAQNEKCFDFLKGRCYRGASCRYLHHDSDNKNDRPRHDWSQQWHSEMPQSSRNLESGREHHGFKFSDKPSASHDTIMDVIEKGSVKDAIKHSSLVQDSEPNIENGEKLGVSEVNAGLFNQPAVQEAIGDPISHPDNSTHLQASMVPFQREAVHLSQENISNHLQPIDCLVATHPSSLQTSSAAPSQLPGRELSSSKMSSEASSQENPLPSGSSSSALEHHVSQLPSPPALQPSHPVDAAQTSHSLGAHYSIASTSGFPLQPPPAVTVPFQTYSSTQQLYHVQPNQPWSNHPLYVMNPTIPATPYQFQQGNLGSRNELVRPITGQLPAHSQVTGFQGPPQRSFFIEGSHGNPSKASIALTNQLGGHSILRDDSYEHSSNGNVPSSLFPLGNTSLQSTMFREDMASRKLQSLPFDNRLAGEMSDHLHHQQKQPLFVAQRSLPNQVPSHLTAPSTSSRCPADPIDKKLSGFSDVGGSVITAHYNPYATTFDQPLNSKFGSRNLRTEGDSHRRDYDASYSSVPTSMEGQGAQNFGLKHAVASLNPSPAFQPLPRAGGDQYDPFEPGSGALEKQLPKQDPAADNADTMVKLNDSHEPLDIGENKMGKNGDVPTISMENDEFGQTADAEVRAVENGSACNLNEEADASAGEDEIDQEKSKDMGDRNNDSRSMKLFRAELADFVKEVLKPSWREGSMSKEAFKTIVKKTVEKVATSMKNKRVPKSKEKIIQYIDSSHWKLTQLVEGYVNKYAKA
ncbi:Zinc finger CCCH domain-containing protein [Drosera capensis]